MKTMTSQAASQPIRRGRNRAVAVLMALLMAITAMSFVAPTPAAATLPEVTPVAIPTPDGATLAAWVARPDGPGPHPIVIMPSSWGIPGIQYSIPAERLATNGFVAISFASRGFWGSTLNGQIDIAGDLTVGDVSTLIDFARDNYNGDENRVGTLGISYGGGIGLLSAAEDPRIKAVVAMSSWSDLEAAMYPNQTLNTGAASRLLNLASSTGIAGPVLESIAEEFERGEATTALEIAPSRSAKNDLATLNANGTAILFTHNYGDSIFGPTQTIDMFEALQGPKKLVLTRGDHGTGEVLGLTGVDVSQWQAAYTWLDRHVAGRDVDTGPAVVAFNADIRREYTASSWAAMSSSDTTYHLTQPRSKRVLWWRLPSTGELRSSASTGWSHGIDGGRAGGADSPDMATTLLGQTLFNIPTVRIDGLSRSASAVWRAPTVWSNRTIAGEPELSITVEPQTDSVTFFAYLYEEDALGFGKLITHEPFTIRDATPGVPVSIDMRLESIVWELSAGSRLTLVIDTVDHAYATESANERVIFLSPNGAPAKLTVPFR